MKLIWLTDIHLNFLDVNKRKNFYQNLLKNNADALLITGDIAEAPNLVDILEEMVNDIKKAIYFVLGNHDYYRSQINSVRAAITELTAKQNYLFWLPAAGIQQLDNNTILVGQDGWADGRLGDYYHSDTSLNDSRMIADLFQQKILGKTQLLEKMQQLADNDAQELNYQLDQAIAKRPEKIIILTHVPPFKEAATYKGKISDDDNLPFFTSKATGDILLNAATENNTIEFLVLCGHTHGKAFYQPLHNLVVKAGKAEYYSPDVQEIIDTEKK